MTDLEFDLLDELYFVKSYPEIRKALEWEDEKILSTLKTLLEKGWIRCYFSPTEEIMNEEIHLEGNFMKYYYLASKDGLFAHNSTE
jgi:hypothetical protein